MGGSGLLAPIPAVHIASAMDVCGRKGKVAFGTNLVSLFTKGTTLTHGPSKGQKVKPERSQAVLFYVSGSDEPEDSGLLRATYKAAYIECIFGDDEPVDIRPTSTLESDTSFKLFWIVNALEKLARPIPLTDLLSKRTGKPLSRSYVPRRPSIVAGDAV